MSSEYLDDIVPSAKFNGLDQYIYLIDALEGSCPIKSQKLRLYYLIAWYS